MEKRISETEILWAKCREDAIVPTRDLGNAGYDIYANFDGDALQLPAHKTVLVPTGIACGLNDKYYFQVEERGSTGSKGLKKSAGVIDASYRGEIFIAITNANDTDWSIVKDYTGEENTYPYTKAIAQLVLHEVPVMDSRIVSLAELQNDYATDRGSGALGSSGK